MAHNAEVSRDKVRSGIRPRDLVRLDHMADSEHMRPVIEYGDCWEATSDKGETFIVPSDLVSIPNHDRFDNGRTINADSPDDEPTPPRQHLDILSRLWQYAPEGISGGYVTEATVRRGVYLCRLSAPGYMDCTDWECHDTAQAAANSLLND